MNEEPFPDKADGEDGLVPEDEPIQEVSIERMMRLLECGEIFEEQGRLRWSSNYTTITIVKDDELESLAVYKPQRGERPLWDFPDGTLCLREVAAYQVSDFLGWDVVAPTVLREGPKGLGSLQFFIEHDPSVNYFSLDETFIPQLKILAAFDALVNNTDRKGGHCLVDGRGKLWGIDHGICFHAEPKLRTVIWDFAGEPIPEQLVGDMQRLVDDLETRGALWGELETLLMADELEALHQRAKRLVQRRKFPHPGIGPSYPWPPV